MGVWGKFPPFELASDYGGMKRKFRGRVAAEKRPKAAEEPVREDVASAFARKIDKCVSIDGDDVASVMKSTETMVDD